LVLFAVLSVPRAREALDLLEVACDPLAGLDLLHAAQERDGLVVLRGGDVDLRLAQLGGAPEASAIRALVSSEM
jgi:hypothetical protein